MFSVCVYSLKFAIFIVIKVTLIVLPKTEKKKTKQQPDDNSNKDDKNPYRRISLDKKKHVCLFFHEIFSPNNPFIKCAKCLGVQ